MTKETRYLRLIATWKLIKGLILLLFGFSLLFLDIRETWYLNIITWIDYELMTPRTMIVGWVLQKILRFLVETNLQITGIMALVYAVVLAVEGIGVFYEQRWAEWLMVIATGSLIPVECYHLFHRFTWVKVVIIVANMLIVWYLYKTLDRHRKPTSAII